MTEEAIPQRQTLEGEAALDLWRQGPGAWNKWIFRHPRWNISFEGGNFSIERNAEGNLSFNGYYFGQGDVDFSKATFGDGDVSFSKANFGDGSVSFCEATFGKGNVDFSKATFGEGDVNFSHTSFGDGDAYFTGANFGNGAVNFDHATFGNGGVYFTAITFGKGNVNFSKTIFGDGGLNFEHTSFGDGDVDFSQATFGEGGVHFTGTTFGKGKVRFPQTTFGSGTVNFMDADFGEGDVNFSQATFGDGGVHFTLAAFGKGRVDFSKTIFGKGDVYFEYTNFGNGPVHFDRATFNDGDVTFRQAQFGKDNLIFSKARFGNGDLNFSFATFEDSQLYFSETTFGKGNIDFSSTNISNLFLSSTTFENSFVKLNNTNLTRLILTPKYFASGSIEAQGLSIKKQGVFDLPSSASKLKSLNLHSASFDGPLTLKGNLSIIPDLRATRYAHQVDLSALTVKLQRRWQKPGLRSDQLHMKAASEVGVISRLSYKFARKKWINLRHFNKLRRLWKRHCWPIKLSRAAEDPLDAARLRRLKEFAETNKDHQAALRFSADENRARRWIETPWLGSILDMTFSFFCNYGQSILRPSFWLGVIFALSMYAYKAKQIPKLVTDSWTDWAQAALLSASNSLPFLPQSRELRTGALKALYDTTDPSSYVDALMITQGALSFVFLFLIGLGLRNRFRL